VVNLGVQMKDTQGNTVVFSEVVNDLAAFGGEEAFGRRGSILKIDDGLGTTHTYVVA
jgi:hypothetical protein